jgi:hypothetical protein
MTKRRHLQSMQLVFSATIKGTYETLIMRLIIILMMKKSTKGLHVRFSIYLLK